ncbi:hypothetical protein ACFQT4_04440 [Pseudoduganella danionis]|uniref:hypothetical protein n=1 Tax=Pseudoduganella danionis TaxID=1890295 RepID=UPI00360C91FC
MYESRSNSDLLPFYVAPGHPDTTLRASLELIEDAEQQDDSATDTVELAYSSYKIRLTGKDGLQLLNAELSEEDFPDAGVHDFWLGQESLGLRQHLTVSNSPFKLELLITLLDNSIIHAETCFKVEVGKIQVLLGNVDDLTYPTPDRPVPTRNPNQDALENRKYAYTLWHNEEYRRRNNALIQTLRQQVSKELGQAYPDSAPLPLKPYSKADSQLVLQLAGNCFMTGYAEMYDNTGFRSYQDLWTYKTALAGPWKQGPMIPLYAQPLLRCSGLEHQYCVDVEAVRGLVLNWTWQTGITVSPDPNLPDAIKAALDKAYTTSGEHPRRRADTSPIFGGQRYRCPLMQLSGQQPPATELNAVGMAKLDGLSSVLNGALRLVPIDLINDGKVAQTRLDESGYSRVLMYGPVISKDSICLRLGLAHDDSEVSTLDSYCFSSMRTVTVHNHMFREGENSTAPNYIQTSRMSSRDSSARLESR